MPTTNLLRLWKAEATESFDLGAFNVGDYYGAVDEKVTSETISKVLYPNDEPEAGKQLWLAQQYFFVSCSLQDMIRLLQMRGKALDEFHLYWAAQLNDTHPSIAIAELMRLLIDEHTMEWDQAWTITQKTCGYTNHALLAEALEGWPLPLFARLLLTRFDWLSRSVAFIAALMDSRGFDLAITDMPGLSDFTCSPPLPSTRDI